jgi:hypothetical protein
VSFLTEPPSQNSTEALNLVSASPPTKNNNDGLDFSRALEFLSLRAEQIEHDELNRKRKAVAGVITRITGVRTTKNGDGEEDDNNPSQRGDDDGDGDGAMSRSQSSRRLERMAGSWIKGPGR